MLMMLSWLLWLAGKSSRKSLYIINNDTEDFTYNVLESSLYSAGCADHVIVTPMTATILPHSRSVTPVYSICHPGDRIQLKVLYCVAVNGSPPWQLQSVTCHLGSHSVTCYVTQVNTPHRLNPSQTSRYSIYLPRSWPSWLVTYRDGLCARRRSPIKVLTGPSID